MMKTKKRLLIVTAMLSILLLIPAFVIPSTAAVSIYVDQTFDDLTLGATGNSALRASFGQQVPSKATVVENPAADADASDYVIKMVNAVEASGDVGYDFFIYASYTQKITWDDETTKASGTATRSNSSSATVYNVTSTDGGATVSIEGVSGTYTTYRDAAIQEATDGNTTGNIDRNLVVKNTTHSYDDGNDNTIVVLQSEYYLPDGAMGTFESQQTSYKIGTTSKSYLNYFKINTATGALTTSHILDADGNTGSTVLEKNVWNTITIVLNLDTGAADLYVNNILLLNGQITVSGTAVTQLTLNANAWNIAKINKNGGKPENLAGCFYVNNAIMHGYSTSFVQDLSASSDLLYSELTLRSGRKLGAGPADTIFVNEGVTAQSVYASDYADVIAPVEGASIRLTNTSGIRFATQLSTPRLNELLAAKEAGFVKNVEIGTLITPYTYVVEAGDFTVDALSKLSYSAKYLDVKAKIGAYFNDHGLTLDEGYNTTFVGSIIDVRPDNRDRLFTGMGYVRITLLDGSVKYIYSYDYTDATTQENKYSRSIQYVASKFVNDPTLAEYQELLQSFMDGFTVMDITSSYVQNVQYSYNELFFQNAAGVSCQLVYDGNNGWRLQAISPTQVNSVYNEFDNIGAAQALSLYLEETYDDEMVKLTVTQDSTNIIVHAEGTDSYATLNYADKFELQFYSPDGEKMNNVTSITADGETVTVKGDLLTGEAVYGGGERFDAANKRGKTMSLYTYDAYNAGGQSSLVGTYTVIPLFTFTRGSGLFINRYEIMNADWGATTSTEWSVSIDNDLIDCYFYATGNMMDAIKGYTDLSGHATLPPEWGQGLLICRYSPDFSKFEGEQMYFSTFESLPNYESLTTTANGSVTIVDWLAEGNEFTNGTRLYSGSTIKYMYADGQFVRTTKKGNPSGAGVKFIVESLIEAGMKPSAMVLEGTNWNNIGNANNYNNLLTTIEWLEEQDINVTVYMGIGAINKGMPGYKEEYAVHATITNTISIENGYSETSGSLTKTTKTWTHSHVAGEQTTINIPKSAASSNPDAFGTGTQVYLDITNPEAVDWYMNDVWGPLIDMGLDGCKIDFCETMPNDNTTVNLIGLLTTVKKPLLGSQTTTTANATVGTTTIQYNWYDDSVFEGDDIHHAYASYFISLYCQRMQEMKEEKALTNSDIDEGFVVLNRGGGIGMQRNPYMWAGDQTREEWNLTTQLMSVINSGISGLPFMTYDMAGYAYPSTGGYWGGTFDAAGAETMKATESEIFVRAIQYSAFSLMIQTHGDVRHVYELSEEAQAISATYNNLHTDLLDYIQKYSKIACDTGIPVLRHLVLHYQDNATVYDIDDQYMFGDALMVAPILTLGTTTRDVYLPEGEWLDLLTGAEYSVGAEGMTISVTAQINQIPVFLETDALEASNLLKNVFNGEAWQSINGGVTFEVPNVNDAFENDIFFPAN
ncbi:MAG: glycoside hydrolase family 31 protein [Clostridia bacterium]|nr:glycoside hydrolase family 31 protein [Clostridia bacterium]